jgi:hypothetical protein
MASALPASLHGLPARRAQLACGQAVDIGGQQVAQGLKVNVAGTGLRQQLTEVISHQNPFYFCMNGVDVQLLWVKRSRMMR